MIKGFTKGLKPLLVKQLALLIGICYLMNPLQQQIITVFHEVSHALEIPDYILSHEERSNYAHDSYDHMDSKAKKTNHNHMLVDLIDSVLEASNDKGDSDDSILIDTKIDKHLTSNQFQIRKLITYITLSKTYFHKEELRKLFLKNPKEPPQLIHT